MAERRRLLSRLLVGGMAGGVVAGFANVWMAAALGPLRVGMPGHVAVVGPAMLLPQSILPGFIGAFLLEACDPLDARGRGFFAVLSVALLLVSFSLPMSTGLDRRSILVLSSMHLTTAVAVLGGLWLAMPRRVTHGASPSQGG